MQTQTTPHALLAGLTVLGMLGSTVALAAPRPRVRKLTVQLEKTAFSGHPGETLTLGGVLRNQLGRRVFISGNRIQLTGRALTADQAPFFAAAPSALANGGKSRPLPLCGLTVRLDTQPGTYEGSVVVLGGARRGDQDVLGQAPFRVTVY